MKKLFIAALFLVGLTGFAQENGKMGKRDEVDRFTPEQRNQLQLKKMTLDLSLTSSQQQDMSKIIADRSSKMETMRAEMRADKDKGVKPTADDRFKKENDRLDYQIAEKAKMRKVLNAEQFAKWENMHEARKFKMHHNRKRKGEKRPNPENAPK